MEVIQPQTVLLCEPGLAIEQPDMVFGGIKLALRQADGRLLALTDERWEGSLAVIG